MKNSVQQYEHVEIQLASTLKLSSVEEKAFKAAMKRVAHGMAACGHHFMPKGQISVAIELCGQTKIKRLNQQFRHKNKATDVLSFQMHDNIRKLKSFPLPMTHLGDIFICREVALKQSRQFNVREKDEWIHLAVHGILHLCGFDHEISAKEEKLQQKWEDLVLQFIADNK